MRKLMIAALAATLPLAMSGHTLAQSAPDHASLDTNGDGAVSLAEVKAALPDLADEAIIAADADQDGNLSAEEYAALTAS